MRVHICSLMLPLIEARALYLCLCLIMMEGSLPCSRTLPGEAGLVCSSFFFFFEVVDGQTLIKGVSCFIFENKYIKGRHVILLVFCFFIASCSVVLLGRKEGGVGQKRQYSCNCMVFVTSHNSPKFYLYLHPP